MRVEVAVILFLVLVSSVSAATSSVHGNIVVDPSNPEFLEYADGTPYWLCAPGEPEGFLFQGTKQADGTRLGGGQSDDIARLARTGANGVYIQLVRSHGGDGDVTQNPWIGEQPSGGLDQDILDQWEGWFDQMDAAGITMYLFFYDDGADPFNTADMEASERDFVRDIVNEFKHHKNLVWVIAEEYSEDLSVARVSQIAAEIKTNDPVHPAGNHQLKGLLFDHPDDSNLDQFLIQSNGVGADDFHNKMLTAWNNAAGRYNLNFAEPTRGAIGTGIAARQIVWAIMMGGAYVMPIDWDLANTPIERLEECGYAVEFFESVDVQTMGPHDELASGSTNYVFANPGTSYILYGRSGGSPGVLGLTSGIYSLKWLDTIDGSAAYQNLSLSGTTTLLRPSEIGT
ncbi:hypothetical protein GOV11_03895, partial [Candidatus Woesearchaeota archaeon]|nr:hypothetical protein [Candidatus Woesearchaeota archaeon]